MEKIQIIAGRGNPQLAKKISQYLKIPLTPVEIKNFASGEIYVRILKKVRNNDIFVVQSMGTPVNDNLIELLIMIDALKRASAGKISVVCPLLCYSRQDRKIISREPISAKLVADLITKAGADRLITVDLHVDQIQGYYDIPVDHLVGYPQFAQYLLENKYKDIVIVAPDIGAVKKAMKMASILHVPLCFIDKRRPKHNSSEIVFVVGEVKNKTAVILDEMIDTGGTVCNAASTLMEKGAKEVIICATHGLLNGDSVEKLKKCPASKIILLDTVNIPKEKLISKIEVLTLAPLLSKVIYSIHTGKSLGSLFTWEKKEIAL